MSNLNKIKEESTIEFEKNWANTPIIKDEKIIKNLILDWHNKQIDKAYSLAIEEVVENMKEIIGIVDEDFLAQPDAEDYVGEWAINKDRQRISQALDSLKQKLLQAKE